LVSNKLTAWEFINSLFNISNTFAVVEILDDDAEVTKDLMLE
jgi:hypothetical protein